MNKANNKFQNPILWPVDEVPLTKPKDNIATQPKPFIFGLHAGLMNWDDSFDDELPYSFWFGYDEEKEKHDSNS